MRILFVTVGIFALDQITKFLVKGLSIPFLGINIRGMDYGQSTPLLGTWLKLTFIENPNMAFGLEIGGKLFLTLFAFIASLALVYYLYRRRHDRFLFRLALALVIAGALGNLTDRVFYGLLYGYGPFLAGNVVDFIDFDLFVIHFGNGSFKFWPIFNVADSAVTVGVVLLLIMGKTPSLREGVASAPSEERKKVEDAGGTGNPAEKAGTRLGQRRRLRRSIGFWI